MILRQAEEAEAVARRFLRAVKQRAAKEPKHIAFPEPTEPRILKGIKIALREGTVSRATLIGNEQAVMRALAKHGLGDDARITVIDPEKDPRTERFIAEYARLRSKKGMSLKEARLAFTSVGYPSDAPNYHPKYFWGCISRQCCSGRERSTASCPGRPHRQAIR